MDPDTQQMLASSLRRALLEPAEGGLFERLSELGWEEVVADDAPTALRTLFEVKGESMADVDALGPVLGREIARVAAASGTPCPPGSLVMLPSSLHADGTTSSAGGGRLRVDGVLFSPAPPSASVLVPVDREGEFRLAVVRASDLAVRPATGSEADPRLYRAEGLVDSSAVSWIAGAPAREAWQATVTLGRWAVSAELVGVGGRTVSEAVAYAADRRQYGRAIGTFQALQHRLAAAYASIIGASHLVAEAADSGSPWAALVAKAVAGRAAEQCCTQAQQTYGAIGFTWEHPFHRSLRRVYILDRLLGGWRELEYEIGIRLQADGVVPRIGSL